jgi:hypothetical protein
MPVTAKLSQNFYQRLGDDVANELVEWLNAVDTSYRQEFKDLFEANFGRVEAQMGELRAEVRHEMGEVRADLGRLESRVDAKLSELKSELLRWMFLFWVGTMGTVLAILKL